MKFFLVLALTALTLSACYVDDEQRVEANLINAPAAKLMTCFGKPSSKISVGIEQIWVYDVGALRIHSWLPAWGADERPPFSAPSGDCQLRFTVDSHGVRGVRYTNASGLDIPQTEVCESAVRRCLKGPAS